MRYTPESLAHAIGLLAPSECCDDSATCCKGFGEWTTKRPEDWPRCQTNPDRAAAPTAYMVRLGQDQERTETNTTGGGPKNWLPSKNGWFSLASLATDIEGAEMEEGVYRIVFGDEFRSAINKKWVELTIEWKHEPSTNPDGAANPGPTQSHYDRLHVTVVEREKSLNQATEGQAQATRRSAKAAASIVRDSQQTASGGFALVRESQEVARGQIEAAGMITQAAQEAARKIAAAAQSATPQRSVVVELLETLAPYGVRLFQTGIEAGIKKAVLEAQTAEKRSIDAEQMKALIREVLAEKQKEASKGKEEVRKKPAASTRAKSTRKAR